jgi:superfamily II DNA/RNA helicase
MKTTAMISMIMMILMPAFFIYFSSLFKALVLAPTRELAMQIAKEYQWVMGDDLSVTTVYGGTP